MKRLKYKHLFYGKTTPVFISTFVVFIIVCSLSMSVLGEFKQEHIFAYFLIISIGSVFLTLAVNYAIIHHLTPEEKKKIAESSPPKWKKIPDRMKKHFKENVKGLFIWTVIIITAEAVLSIITGLSHDLTSTLIVFASLVGITIIVFVCIGINEHIWANMDDSAIYAKIKVDHCFLGERRRGGRDRFLVFYLPDGKYVLQHYSIEPKEIVIIKYKCFIRIEDSSILI